MHTVLDATSSQLDFSVEVVAMTVLCIQPQIY